MKKILIVHGLCHSAERYFELAKQMTECGYEVSVVDLPGFGKHKYDGDISKVEQFQIEYLRGVLTEDRYDYAVGHSWGARLLLQALETFEIQPVLILLNPVYAFSKNLQYLHHLKFLIRAHYYWTCRFPLFLSKPVIKMVALAYVNRWSDIDDILVNDYLTANPNVATEILFEISRSSIKVDKNNYRKLVLIYSDKDRVLSQDSYNTLIHELEPEIYLIKGKGHTLVLEDLTALTAQLKQICQE
ncbi:MAG: alpha/beta hydrolase [Eubacteriales bacterium]